MLIASLRDSLPPRPWEKLTDRLWDALVIAEEEAEFLGDERIGAEHLLLGLAVEGNGVGARVLAELGVEAPRLRLLLGCSRRGAVASSRVGIDEATRRALRLMVDECATLGHERIGQEHLLLALTSSEEGAAGGTVELLGRLGVAVDGIRARVLDALARSEPPPPSSEPRADGRARPTLPGLVIVDGIMGAGKSTTGRWLARELGRHGTAAHFLPEGPTVAEPEHPLRVAPGLPHPKAPWLDLSADEFAERSLAMWRSFVAALPAAARVTVCDGLLFHGNLTDLVLMDAAPDLLRAYVARLVETTHPLSPSVIYLGQSDVPAALRRVGDQRGPAWVDYQVGWKLASPFARRHGLTGYDGLVRLYERYVARCRELLAGLTTPMLLIELDGDWSGVRPTVRSFLRLDPTSP